MVVTSLTWVGRSLNTGSLINYHLGIEDEAKHPLCFEQFAPAGTIRSCCWCCTSSLGTGGVFDSLRHQRESNTWHQQPPAKFSYIRNCSLLAAARSWVAPGFLFDTGNVAHIFFRLWAVADCSSYRFLLLLFAFTACDFSILAFCFYGHHSTAITACDFSMLNVCFYGHHSTAFTACDLSILTFCFYGHHSTAFTACEFSILAFCFYGHHSTAFTAYEFSILAFCFYGHHSRAFIC